ncbi:hypothetical protein [Agrococcus beijingensis]|uniref:hypothetical protein n=1 Tax=Agrococcus beijingensis TaxID=3068634 RepID=UPI00274086FB|nr:hypothetical protein [Agrococcus sp. REN33]
MGPLIWATHRDNVVGDIGTAEADGATVAVDGRDPEVDGDPNGFWVDPYPVEAYARIARGLLDGGLPEGDVRKLVNDNPANLLGLSWLPLLPVPLLARSRCAPCSTPARSSARS